MSANYKLTFWDLQAGDGVVGPSVWARAAKAALVLQQEHPDILFASSAGGHDAAEPLELALLVPIDREPHSFQPFIERAISKEGSTSHKVSLKSGVEYFEFASAQLASLDEQTHIGDADSAWAGIDELSELPRAESISSDVQDTVEQLVSSLRGVQSQLATAGQNGATGPAAEAELAEKFLSEAKLEAVSISSGKLHSMKAARGIQIEAEIKALQDGLRKISVEKNTNIATLHMLASGLVTIGKGMWKLYLDVKGEGDILMGPMISSLLTKMGGVAKVAPIAAAIVRNIDILHLIRKPNMNDLVLVNGTPTEVTLENDYVMSGHRNNVTTTIEAGIDPRTIMLKPSAYPAGFFVYSEVERHNTTDGPSFGYWGSTAGLAFKRSSDGLFFSVGVDCPVTIYKKNGVQVMTGNDAKRIAEAVDRHSKDTDSAKVGRDTVTVSRAAAHGSINHCICWTGQ